MDTYLFPYGEMKGINRIIYEKFRRRCYLKENHIVNMLTKEYLHKHDDIKKMIIEKSELMTNIFTYLMDIKVEYDVLNSFYDSVVEYIVENKYEIENEMVDLLLHIISSEKMYDLIIYNISLDTTFQDGLLKRIMNVILKNKFIVTLIKYRYKDIRTVEEVIYPYYLQIIRLQDMNISMELEEEISDNDEYGIIEKSNDVLYRRLINSVMRYVQTQIIRL